MRRSHILPTILLVLIFGAPGCERPDSPLGDGEVQVLRRGGGGEPGSLDPVLAEDIHAFNVLTDLYEGLVIEESDGQLAPGTAESWTISEDGLTYTFTIRQNAKWSNGNPVEAADFVRAFRRVASPDSQSSYAFLHEVIENFAEIQAGELPVDRLGVVAKSDDALEIRLSAPTSHWLAILALPISFPAAKTLTEPPISNGAYQLVERKPGGAIRLAKNEHYWAASGDNFDEVIWHPIVNPATEFSMYRAGELDVTHSVPPEQIKFAQEQLGDELHISPYLALYYMAFDLGEAPFDNALLRQALTMAVNREALVTLLGRGEQPAYGIVPPGVNGYDSVSYTWRNESQEKREEQAQELYSLAGYSSVRPLTIDFVYDAGDIHEKVALAVSAMWRDVLGVETSLDKREWMYFLDTRDLRSEWDVMRFAWFGDYNGPQTFLDIFSTENAQNLVKFENAVYDDLLNAANLAANSEETMSLLRAAEAELIGEYPVVPLYFFVSKHMVKPHVFGFTSNVTDRHPSKYLRPDLR